MSGKGLVLGRARHSSDIGELEPEVIGLLLRGRQRLHGCRPLPNEGGRRGQKEPS